MSFLSVGSVVDIFDSDEQPSKADNPDTMTNPRQIADITTDVNQSHVTQISRQKGSDIESQEQACMENETGTNNNCIAKHKCQRCDYATNS